MKKRTIISLLLVMFCFSLYSQELRLRKEDKRKAKVIKAGTSIKIKSTYGTFRGRFEILDDSTISIGNHTIPISEITQIKKRIATDHLLFYTMAWFGTNMVYFALVQAPFGNRHKKSKGWYYEAIKY